jgi:hypothetical protein
MDKLTVSILALAFGVAGCSETTPYVSTPDAQQAMGSAATEPPVSVAPLERPRETPLGRYDVPPSSPHGEVAISSFGVNELQVGDQQQSIRFMQLRMKVTNKDDSKPWTVDVRQQLLSLPNEGKSQPAFINVDQRDLPNVTIAVGQTRTIDLYYALPQTLQAPTQAVPASELLWHVETSGQTIAERTSIGEQKPQPQMAGAANPQATAADTSEQPPPPPAYEYPYPYDAGYYGWGLGVAWGPVWWFNPFFPSVAFVHPVFFNHQHFFVHHPFVAPRAVHAANVHNAFVGPHVHAFGARGVTLHHASAFHGTTHAVAGRSFAGGYHATGFHGGDMHGSAIHGGGSHGGGGFHGGGFGGGGFHGGGGGFHGGGGGFHGGGGGFHGGGGGGHR